MTSYNNRHKFPYQQSIPMKYMDDSEPMSGSGADVRNSPPEQRQGYQVDPLHDLEAIRARIRSAGFELSLNGDEPEVSLVSEPLFTKLKGITPQKMQFQLLPKSHADKAKYREYIGKLSQEGLSEGQEKLAKGLWNPQASLGGLARLMEWEKEWTLPTDEMSDKNPTGEGQSKLFRQPAKLLPKREQFSEAVQRLGFGDIFTIFQDSQLEQIKLFLGRVCVGHSGTTNPITGQKLTHTYRNILVVDGQYPGQGKSTLFGWVTEALEVAGYGVCKSVPSLSGRFNLREPFESDLSYRDDENSDNLAKELASPVAKIMATNGIVATEDKGKDAKMTKCKTALLINANRVEKRLFWGMDDGMRSRITLCETVPEGVLPASELPFNKIPRLAKELDVDIATLMLWCLRLATDEFLKYCNENAHQLEHRIKELESSANKSNADPLDGILAAIALGNMLENPGQKISPRLNLDTLNAGIRGVMKIKQAGEYKELAVGLMDTLRSVNGRVMIPGWHPIQGLNLLDPASLPRAYELSQNRSRMTSPNARIKEVFESLSLSDGNQCYGRPDVVLPRWTNLISNQFTFKRLLELAEQVLALKPEKCQLPVDTDYSIDAFWNLC